MTKVDALEVAKEGKTREVRIFACFKDKTFKKEINI